MIHIAICDQEKEFVKKMKRIIDGYLQKAGIAASIDFFHNVRKLLWTLDTPKCYDLVLYSTNSFNIEEMAFLDRIHKKLPDACLILLTEHSEYKADSLDHWVFRYILKDQIDQLLGPVVKTILLNLMEQRKKAYTVFSKKQMIKVNYQSVFSINREGNYSSFTLASGKKVKERKSLAQVYSYLDPDKFVYINRGTIANLEHISSIQNGVVQLSNGSLISLSRNKVKNVMEKLKKYYGKGKG